jgi:pilus assembly protein Flp/PilA
VNGGQAKDGQNRSARAREQHQRGMAEMSRQPHDEGQGLVEYALVLVLIAIVVIAIYLLVEPAIADLINQLKNSL